MRTGILLLLAFLMSFSPLQAQNGSKKDPGNWTPEDVINQERASDLNFSPDGHMVVWAKRRPDKEKDRFVSDLYLTRLNLKDEDGNYKTIQLTRGNESDHDPIWSANGETIYFLSSREKGKKLWAMSVYGGEPYEVHTFDTGIADIKWMGDHTLAFRSDEGKTLYEKEYEEKKDNSIVVEDSLHFKPKRIYSFDLKTKQVKRLTDNDFPVSEYEVTRDGKWLVTEHIMSPTYAADANPDPTYYLWNLVSGEKRQILEGDYQTPGGFEFSKDNKGFYFYSVLSSDPEWNGAGISVLHYYNLSDNSISDVPLDWDWGLGGGYDVVGNDVLVSLANGATRKLALYERDGDSWDKKSVDAGSMDEHVTVVAVGKDDRKLAYVYSTASTLPQYRLGKLDVGRRGAELTKGSELINLNKQLEKKTKAQSEVITWTGAMGDEVTGILYYPRDYKEGRRYPLVVSIHGGPSGVDTDEWSESWAYMPNLMAQRGAFVLMPNYHGSSNHGREFVESIKGHYYEYELPDIINGINMLADKGMVDKDSLGVKGWSNGAILTNMLIVKHPDLFKVAAPGAGDVNWTSDFGTCRFGVSFDASYFGGAPWDDTDGKIYNEAYIKKSPLFELEKVKTPTIIFHGSEDRAVPRDQGWEYYRALQQIGKAPVRFIWFPGEPHGLRKITHQTRKVKEELRWFDKYLFDTFKPENEAFKEGSPLAEVLKKDQAERQDGLWGRMVNGKLVPEVQSVKDDSISIGRFEVTNAQFAAFRPDYEYPAVQANYPVTGLSYDDAVAYTKWLSDLTGKTYRLPNADEAKGLQKRAKKVAANENTLNYWAGYEITVDEVPMLREKLSGLNHSLLQSVGGYKGTKVGEALVYDLGGNAAEWNRTANGSDVYGYSAISYVDDRAESQQPELDYIGFRVVKEQD